MKILVINSGSSSVKFKLFQHGKKLQELASGMIDSIGTPHCTFIYKTQENTNQLPHKTRTNRQAIKTIIRHLISENLIKNHKDIAIVGHRVVHGGDKLTAPTLINKNVIKEIAKLTTLAPLHNNANLKSITNSIKLIKQARHVAIFDTAFHQTMPEVAYRYAIPTEYLEKHKIRRYGFHGTSHSYVIKEAIKLLKNKSAKIISCHLGNGSSITAYHKKVLDTTMGFGPLEGIPMGTRSGTIDPTIILHLSETLKMPTSKIKNLLNNESGLKALSELSSDMRLIHQAATKGDQKAQFAIKYLAYRCALQIAGYIAILGGVDAITFTAGIGRNAYYLRQEIFQNLKIFGITLSPTANKNCQQLISKKTSTAKVFIIPTDEELEIANQSLQLIKSLKK
ncbi:acetate kinase [Candidatus Peregrinibacteria bacterium HGW-Peregrinibacteria-1]|jgi:acetate kinase|nr:MAG: acetate kinase [Candidatus Peregrinibacteria bacterium HGW-Peregrinibacteria-1]